MFGVLHFIEKEPIALLLFLSAVLEVNFHALFSIEEEQTDFVQTADFPLNEKTPVRV